MVQRFAAPFQTKIFDSRDDKLCQKALIFPSILYQDNSAGT
jgi:hypothetical protein